MIGIDHLTRGDVYVTGLVVRLNPRLIELVPHAKVQRQLRRSLVCVVDETSHTPLTLPHVDTAQRRRSGTYTIQQEVRRAITQGTEHRIRRELAVVRQRAKKAVVIAGRVVVLVAQRLNTGTDRVQPFWIVMLSI